jgi:hypothetical protein
MKPLQQVILVIVLLVVGYFLLPFVKTNKQNNPPPQTTDNSQNPGQQPQSAVKTFTSDDLGISFTYNADQNADGSADTTAKQSGDKAYVYYSASPMEQGQWVEKFSKDPKDSLTAAIQKQFLTKYSSKDCYALNLTDYYKNFQVEPPNLPANVQEAVIAYPQPADPADPFWQNAAKCPPTYSATNGISYFWMDSNHPNEYFFFSIGQYAIFADTTGQKNWQDTFTVTK